MQSASEGIDLLQTLVSGGQAITSWISIPASTQQLAKEEPKLSNTSPKESVTKDILGSSVLSASQATLETDDSSARSALPSG